MPNLKESGIEIFNEFSSAVNKCRRELIQQAWFRDDWWINSSLGSSGFGFQLSKTHWHNHNGQGIHFEFWIEQEQTDTKRLPIVLHFEPDTPNRKKLGERFAKAMEDRENEFSDYRINHSAMCDKMQKEVKFTKSNLHRVVIEEFSRLQTLGDVIDEVLT